MPASLPGCQPHENQYLNLPKSPGAEFSSNYLTNVLVTVCEKATVPCLRTFVLPWILLVWGGPRCGGGLFVINAHICVA
jgi:hypothetical protein